MKNLALLMFLLLVPAVYGHERLARWTTPPPPPTDPRRLISLAPSVTETLYALGLGDRVVGVTKYCHYPPEVLEKPAVAGFSDVNLEAVLRQKPDLAVLPVDKTRNRAELEGLGLAVLPLDTRSLSGLIAAIGQLGRAVGREAEAEEVVGRLAASLAEARRRASGRERPRVLFSVMHSYEGLGYITEINAVGRDGFFSELLELAGGVNVYQGPLAFPRLSREAVIALNPDLIVDVIPGVLDIEAVRRDWLDLGGVAAVRNGRLYFLTDEADTVPGPRIGQTLAKLSLAFHPERREAPERMEAMERREAPENLKNLKNLEAHENTGN